MARHHAASLVMCALLGVFAARGSLSADAIILPPPQPLPPLEVTLLSDQVYVPKPEAPTTVFSTKLGSAEVDLNLQGSWTAAASFGTGLLFSPGLPVRALDSFP